MDTGIIKEYLKDVGSNGKIIIAVVLIIAFAFDPDSFLKLFEKTNSNPPPAQINNYSADGNQVIAPVTARDNAKVDLQIEIGDKHYQGFSAEEAGKLAHQFYEKQMEAITSERKAFDLERREKDALLKSQQEAILALSQQSAKKYDIQRALALLAQGDATKAEEIFRLAAVEAEHKGKKEYIEAAKALRHLGSLAFFHDTKKAFAAYKRSTELDPDNLEGWNILGHLYRRVGELDKAENAYMNVQKLSMLQFNRAGEAAAYGNLGIVCRVRGKLDRAIEYYEKALSINRELVNKEGMAATYGNLGIVFSIRSELDQAIEYHEKALSINRELVNKEGMAAAYGNLGIVYETRHELDRATEYYEKALSIEEELRRKEGMASQYGNLGNVFLIRGELDRATKYHEKALSIEEELRHKEGMASQYGNLGNVYQTRGELDRAIEFHEKALVIDEELGHKEGMANQYGNLGLVYQIRGELDRALKYWKQSLTLFQQLSAKDKIALVQSWIDAVEQKDSN